MSNIIEDTPQLGISIADNFFQNLDRLMVKEYCNIVKLSEIIKQDPYQNFVKCQEKVLYRLVNKLPVNEINYDNFYYTRQLSLVDQVKVDLDQTLVIRPTNLAGEYLTILPKLNVYLSEEVLRVILDRLKSNPVIQAYPDKLTKIIGLLVIKYYPYFYRLDQYTKYNFDFFPDLAFPTGEYINLTASSLTLGPEVYRGLFPEVDRLIPECLCRESDVSKLTGRVINMSRLYLSVVDDKKNVLAELKYKINDSNLFRYDSPQSELDDDIFSLDLSGITIKVPDRKLKLVFEFKIGDISDDYLNIDLVSENISSTPLWSEKYHVKDGQVIAKSEIPLNYQSDTVKVYFRLSSGNIKELYLTIANHLDLVPIVYRNLNGSQKFSLTKSSQKPPIDELVYYRTYNRVNRPTRDKALSELIKSKLEISSTKNRLTVRLRGELPDYQNQRLLLAVIDSVTELIREIVQGGWEISKDNIESHQLHQLFFFYSKTKKIKLLDRIEGKLQLGYNPEWNLSDLQALELIKQGQTVLQFRNEKLDNRGFYLEGLLIWLSRLGDRSELEILTDHPDKLRVFDEIIVNPLDQLPVKSNPVLVSLDPRTISTWLLDRPVGTLVVYIESIENWNNFRQVNSLLVKEKSLFNRVKLLSLITGKDSIVWTFEVKDGRQNWIENWNIYSKVNNQWLSQFNWSPDDSELFNQLSRFNRGDRVKFDQKFIKYLENLDDLKYFYNRTDNLNRLKLSLVQRYSTIEEFITRMIRFPLLDVTGWNKLISNIEVNLEGETERSLLPKINYLLISFDSTKLSVLFWMASVMTLLKLDDRTIRILSLTDRLNNIIQEYLPLVSESYDRQLQLLSFGDRSREDTFNFGPETDIVTYTGKLTSFNLNYPPPDQIVINGETSRFDLIIGIVEDRQSIIRILELYRSMKKGQYLNIIVPDNSDWFENYFNLITNMLPTFRGINFWANNQRQYRVLIYQID